MKAMAEADELGRDVFLARHGFRRALWFLVEHDGRRYDSKAIAGVALGYQIWTVKRVVLGLLHRRRAHGSQSPRAYSASPLSTRVQRTIKSGRRLQLDAAKNRRSPSCVVRADSTQRERPPHTRGWPQLKRHPRRPLCFAKRLSSDIISYSSPCSELSRPPASLNSTRSLAQSTSAGATDSVSCSRRRR
jgi:hypothetical protein